MNGPGERLVRAVCTGKPITVCQACSPPIADAAVATGAFVVPAAGGSTGGDGARP